MLHCPQGIPWSLRVQLLIEEYSFKIMFDFLQEILCLFKGQIHGVILHFRAETSPPFKGIAIYIIHTVYMYICIYIRVPFSTRTDTMPYSFTRTAMCLEDYFLKGMPHTFERNTVYTCILIIIFQYNIIK